MLFMRLGRSRSLVILLLLACCVGCAGDMFSSNNKWAMFGSKKKKPPGPEIISPRERMQAMTELAKKANKMSPEEQQAESVKLGQLIQSEQDPWIRAHIVHTLASFDSPAATAVITAAVHDADRDVRLRACEAWGKRGGPDGVKILMEMTEDSELDVRTCAIKNLGTLKDKSAVPTLAAILDDRDPALQYRAVVALREISGKDFGDDVGAWRKYTTGSGEEPAQISVGEKMKRRFF
ncbi:MAG: HEAT repeat domain-containing protein [Planctomycetes bacterium]|nr:HEAT repeat domain-containing protein [Planctomycetota bacterium]